MRPSRKLVAAIGFSSVIASSSTDQLVEDPISLIGATS